MTLAATAGVSAQSDPVRGRAGRAIYFIRRHAWIVGLATWAAGAVALILHGAGLAFPDPTRFAMLETWLVSAGCVGCPALAMRALGRRLTPYASALLSAVLAAMAGLLTALMVAGQMHPKPLTATFAVILPLAGAVQALNAADAEVRAARREAAAYARGRRDGVMGQVNERYAALAGLDRIEGMSPAEIEALIDVARGVLGVKLSDQPLRHLTSVPRTGGSRGGSRRAAPARRIDRA